MGLTTECVPWQGAKTPAGYGQIRIKSKTKLAHRVAWALEYGEYPPYPEKVIDHLCRNPGCINVEHMELTSIGENVLRGETISAVNKAKDVCIQGHNHWTTYVRKDGRTMRQCVTCSRERALRRYYRVKGQK